LWILKAFSFVFSVLIAVTIKYNLWTCPIMLLIMCVCSVDIVGRPSVLASRERPGIGYGQNETHFAELKCTFSLDWEDCVCVCNWVTSNKSDSSSAILCMAWQVSCFYITLKSLSVRFSAHAVKIYKGGVAY
jgi:hypothetical protein